MHLIELANEVNTSLYFKLLRAVIVTCGLFCFYILERCWFIVSFACKVLQSRFSVRVILAKTTSWKVFFGRIYVKCVSVLPRVFDGTHLWSHLDLELSLWGSFYRSFKDVLLDTGLVRCPTSCLHSRNACLSRDLSISSPLLKSLGWNY